MIFHSLKYENMAFILPILKKIGLEFRLVSVFSAPAYGACWPTVISRLILSTLLVSLASCGGGGGGGQSAPPNEPKEPPPVAVDHRSLALVSSMHGSNRLLEVYEIEGAIDQWVTPFRHADFTKLPYRERPVWHLKTTATTPPDAYIAEIKYVSSLGFRVVATMMLLESERLTAPSQRAELLQRIDVHIDMLCNAGACPDVYSVDNEPDINPAPENGSLELWNGYALTLDTIAEGLIAAKAEHGVAIALPAIGLFGHWEEFGSQAVEQMGQRMNEFDMWLYHVYDHPPSFQALYDLERIAREKTANPNIEVVASETGVGFVKTNEDPESKPWVLGELGAIYFTAQIASSLMSGIEPCHFLLVNVNTGIIKRPVVEPSLRQQVAGWLGETLFAPGFVLDKQRSSLNLDTFHIVTSDGTHDRVLRGRYLPRLTSRAVRRALQMKHWQLTREEIENLNGIEDEARELQLSFAGGEVPPHSPDATVLHEMTHLGEDNQNSWFVIEEAAASSP